MMPSDYRKFQIDDGKIVPTGYRLPIKLSRVPLPDLRGKTVLDVGCHSGFWCYLAVERGAKSVLGIDQNPVESPIEFRSPRLAFKQAEIGRTWPRLGSFEVVLFLSVYHHIYQAAGGDHEPVWHWLRNQIANDGYLVAELAMNAMDHTVADMVSKEYHRNYNEAAMLDAASRYFCVNYAGAAVHESERALYIMVPRKIVEDTIPVVIKPGFGLASELMLYADGRRRKEISAALGFEPYPGTLNCWGSGFDWTRGYYRVLITALKDRQVWYAGGFSPRWMRFYPVSINNNFAYAARFEDEYHPKDFIELMAPYRLREALDLTGKATLCRL